MSHTTTDASTHNLRGILEKSKASGELIQIAVLGTQTSDLDECFVEEVYDDCVRVFFPEFHPVKLDNRCVIPFTAIMCISEL